MESWTILIPPKEQRWWLPNPELKIRPETFAGLKLDDQRHVPQPYLASMRVTSVTPASRSPVIG